MDHRKIANISRTEFQNINDVYFEVCSTQHCIDSIHLSHLFRDYIE